MMKGIFQGGFMKNANLQNKSPTHPKINLEEEASLSFWCEELSLRAEELKEIVKKVGPKVQDVREYLAKKFLDSWPAYI